MSASSPNPTELKMLPAQSAAPPPRAPDTATIAPPRQLSELPKDELEHLAEEFGIDATRFPTRQQLVTALHERRQLIASLDREAMLDVVRWGRRPVTANAAREQIAQEIARIRLMNFSGLSERGLLILARLRGLAATESDPVPLLIKRLRKQEGFFAKMSRKRRAALGSLVSKIVGDEEGPRDYQFLPSPGAPVVGPAAGGMSGAAKAATIKQEIEESGLLGGITSRIKKTADGYINQKLDEIEARIDRKLDEIDRRLAEWRDKEIANRIRILKITLWASVIVAALSLIYSYIKVYFYPDRRTPAADVRPINPPAPPAK